MPTIVLILGICVALAACGGDSQKPGPLDGEGDRTGGTTPPAETGTTQDPAGTTSPGGASDARRRLIYLDARTLCGEFGIRQVARRFGLEGGNAADVARAYAEQNYSVPFRGAGYRGCLAGFRK